MQEGKVSLYLTPLYPSAATPHLPLPMSFHSSLVRCWCSSTEMLLHKVLSEERVPESVSATTNIDHRLFRILTSSHGKVR